MEITPKIKELIANLTQEKKLNLTQKQRRKLTELKFIIEKSFKNSWMNFVKKCLINRSSLYNRRSVVCRFKSRSNTLESLLQRLNTEKASLQNNASSRMKRCVSCLSRSTLFWKQWMHFRSRSWFNRSELYFQLRNCSTWNNLLKVE